MRSIIELNILFIAILFWRVQYLFVNCDATDTTWTSRSANNIISAPLSASQRTLTAIKVNPTGQVYSTQILKQQLANELSIPLRDLRVVDPSLPSQIQATFVARPKAILFCIENIKVVVQSHEALVFSPSLPEVQEFIPVLQQNILQNLDLRLDPKYSQKRMRFEHVVLESALNVVCSSLFERIRALSPTIQGTLKALRAESRGLDLVQRQVDELLPLKNKIDELKKRTKEVKRAITEVLNSDEDMERMFLIPHSATSARSVIDPITSSVNTINSDPSSSLSLSSASSSSASIIPNSQSSSSSSTTVINNINNNRKDSSKDGVDIMIIETLFETYLNEIEWISADIEDIQDEIINTEENVELQLDILRNRILRFELNLSIFSFIGTCGTLITGLFGMNLLSHMELNPFSFYGVALFTSVICAYLYIALTSFAKREKLF